MKISLKYREDIIALIELVKRRTAQNGNAMSDTSISKLAFGYGDFVAGLRRWKGGKGGPTVANIGKLETFLRDQLDPEEYDQFCLDRAMKTVQDAQPEGVGWDD